MGDCTADTLVLAIQGVRVRVATTRPAAYLKYLAGARPETVVAYRDGDRQVGLADPVVVADHVATGQRITFFRPDQVDTVVGGARPATAETKLVEVDGQAMLVSPFTTVAQLRDMADAPPDTVFTYLADGQFHRLTDNQIVSNHVPTGAAIQFQS